MVSLRNGMLFMLSQVVCLREWHARMGGMDDVFLGKVCQPRQSGWLVCAGSMPALVAWVICLCRMSNVYISKRNERMFQIVLENVLLYVFIDPELSRFLQTLFSDTSSELFKIYLETFERNTSKTCFKTLLNSQNFTYLLEKSCKRIQNKSDFFQL